ncbi:hypothetical protein HanXRQr2_Chr02g0053671 [Helianthus annuus]|uniref:Uncharacterized protein n=1 Tax=Helianthus annuus TaxID=4232 RepID=A0A9K3JL90_HELAN|nr:hypothetical protein HanXRQr2_Chr02g0053671 [Helianthus annuus]KAJ0950830.1 hypothetical protein HanPSC8_Chr02g0052761 [Helianthus annuus]
MVPDSPEKPANRRSSVGEPSSPKITSELGTLVRTRRRSNRVVFGDHSPSLFGNSNFLLLFFTKKRNEI